MSEKKKMELTRLQGGMAIASFSAGVGISVGCLRHPGCESQL